MYHYQHNASRRYPRCTVLQVDYMYAHVHVCLPSFHFHFFHAIFCRTSAAAKSGPSSSPVKRKFIPSPAEVEGITRAASARTPARLRSRGCTLRVIYVLCPPLSSVGLHTQYTQIGPHPASPLQLGPRPRNLQSGELRALEAAERERLPTLSEASEEAASPVARHLEDPKIWVL